MGKSFYCGLQVSSIKMGDSGPKWPLDSDVIWQHYLAISQHWPKSTYSYY